MPGATHFQLPSGLMPAFRGSDSFPPGNCPPCNASSMNTIGSTHDRRHATIGTPATKTLHMSPLRRDPSAINLASLSGETPPPVDQHVGLATSTRPVLGGPVESPCPSDKERLARLRQVGLFNIRGLATPKYHGGDLGVRVLMVQFIHDCGYRSFFNTMSPEDVLLSYGEIIQVHRKVEQRWYKR